MPNVQDLPMTRVREMYVNEEECYAEFVGKSGQISIKSTARKGIVIRSKLDSQSMVVGINDNFLASVIYRRRTYPIYIILSVISAFVGIVYSMFDDSVGMFVFLFYFAAILLAFAYFLTRAARIAFRLTDEQDYQILLRSGAVRDNELMADFIERILMNSMNHFDEVSTSEEPFGGTTNEDLTVIPAKEQGPNTLSDVVNRPNAPPPPHAKPQATDDNGYEWITVLSGDAYFREANSHSEWTLHEQQS